MSLLCARLNVCLSVSLFKILSLCSDFISRSSITNWLICCISWHSFFRWNENRRFST